MKKIVSQIDVSRVQSKITRTKKLQIAQTVYRLNPFAKKYHEGYYCGLGSAERMVLDLWNESEGLILCKDCMYYAGDGMYCACNILVQYDHFYCYYAERKEAGHE